MNDEFTFIYFVYHLFLPVGFFYTQHFVNNVLEKCYTNAVYTLMMNFLLYTYKYVFLCVCVCVSVQSGRSTDFLGLTMMYSHTSSM